MKVRFFCEGGINAGYGHLTRSYALQTAFDSLNCSTSMIVQGDRISASITGNDFEVGQWLDDLSYFKKLAKKSDIVIFDSYHVKSDHLEILRNFAQDVVFGFFDDLGTYDFNDNFVINNNIDKSVFKYLNVDVSRCFGGKDELILRKPFSKESKYQIKREIKKVTISMGGMDHAGVINSLENAIVASDQKLSVCVLNSQRGFVDTNKIVELMLESDIFISACGQTLLELCCLGVPTIGIQTADNQKINIKTLKNLGWLLYAGNVTDKSIIPSTLKIIDDLKDFAFRKKISSNGQSLIDGKGASKVARKILSLRECA